jgi:ADP-ribose pyrophosphatase YjhB (NUDIX family)
MKQIRISCGGVVINEEEEILVVSQKGINWSLPKGKMKDGESFLETAKREVFEETGVSKLKLIKELHPYQRFEMIDSLGNENKDKIKEIHLFVFKTRKNELNPKDKENPEALWLCKEEAMKKLTHPKDKEFLREVLTS